MKHTRKKSNGMKRHMRMLPVFLVAAVVLILVAAAPNCWADDDEIPFDEAELFFELNDTDGDLGIHALVDGEPWEKFEIEGPKGRVLLSLYARTRLRGQGLTELSFESAEPPFESDDPEEVTLTPERLFRRFPEGTYEFEGRTLEGDELESKVELTHVMPAPPAPTVNGESMAEDCDDESLDYDATEVSAPVTIAWPAVTMSHPDDEGAGAGEQPPVPVTINNYEVVVEIELEVDGEEFTSVFSVVLPPDVRSVAIPEDFLAVGDTFKYEVLAREESFNQTAVESCFVLE
ncbi:MAG: hypothetical protein ACYSSN_10970 [Planctomycetota bacterium]|jgi:hypothetical protein